VCGDNINFPIKVVQFKTIGKTMHELMNKTPFP